ncbi:GNAT family N-acetyltransferase [Candidatus Latescibacterota bacterium]
MEDGTYEQTRGEYSVSTDRSLLDFDVIHAFLTHSYWCPGIPMEAVHKAAANSLNFGLYLGTVQIGYARVVTDYTRYAYLLDVFVLREHRGHGLGKWLMQCVVQCPTLQDLRAIALGTRDAQGLYRQFGFEPVQDPSRYMVRRREMPWYQPDLIQE